MADATISSERNESKIRALLIIDRNIICHKVVVNVSATHTQCGRVQKQIIRDLNCLTNDLAR